MSAPAEFEASQRSREWFHSLRIPDGMWAVVRVDGRSFTTLTSEHGYEKPFDARFGMAMQQTAEQLLTDLGGIYAYTESDEISVALPPSWELFNRSVEKTVSLSAACASSAFSLSTGWPCQFDSRIWLGATTQDVIDYMSWRQSDAARCCLNGWCYWLLRQKGLEGEPMSARAATSYLSHMMAEQKHELLHGTFDINFNDLPAWQRRGIGIWWENYDKPGYNPKTDEHVTVSRRRLHVGGDLPMKDAYRDLVASVLTEHPDA